MPDITRAALRERIARRLEDHVEGTADSAAASTLVDADLKIYPDDHFNGAWLYINGGTGAGQERSVSDFVQTSGTLTLLNAWAPTPGATSTYELHRSFRVDAINDAINHAIEDIRGEYQYAVTVNESITLSSQAWVEGSYLFTLPAGFRELWAVWMEDSTNGIYSEQVPVSHEDIELSTAATDAAEPIYKIRFSPWSFVPIIGRQLKITGSQEQPALLTDTATLHAPLTSFVEHMALYWLTEPRTKKGTPASTANEKTINRHLQLAERFRLNMAQTASPIGAIPVMR